MVGALRGLLIARTTAGTLLAGYRLWSDIWPPRLASPATCQPLR
jgi:hypothetical protein